MDAQFTIKAVDNATRTLRKVSGSVNSFNKNVKSSAKKVSDRWKKNEATFRSMRNTGAVALAGISASIYKTVNAAWRAEEIETRFAATFNKTEERVRQFSKEFAKEFGRAESDIKAMSATLGWTLSAGTDIAEEKVAEMNREMILAAEGMAAFDERITDGSQAMSAMSKALTGNTATMLDRWFALRESDIKRKALEMGLIDVGEELDWTSKALATQKLIVEQSQGPIEALKKSEGNYAETKRRLNAQITNVSEKLGKLFLPIINQVFKKITPIIEGITAWIKENQELTKKITLVATGVAWLVTLLWSLWLAIPLVVKWFLALKGATIAVASAMKFLARNPVWLVITAIWLLVAGWVALYKNRDKVSSRGKKVWSDLSSWIVEQIDWMIDWLNKWIDSINWVLSKVWMAIPEISRLWDEAESLSWGMSKMKNQSQMLASEVGNVWIQSDLASIKFQKAKNSTEELQGGMSKMKNETTNVSNETKDLSNSMGDLWLNTSWAWNAVKDYSDKVRKSFKELQGSADTALAKVTDEFQKQSNDLKKRADEILWSIRSLSQDFVEKTKSDEQWLAKTFVQAKEKQKQMEQDLVQKKKDLRVEDDADRRTKLQKEIMDLQANIQQQKEVWRNSKDMRVRLANQIAEVERRNDMTKLEREIEDFKRREEMRKQEFKKKAINLAKEFVAVKKQQEKIQQKHEYAQAKIQSYMKVTTEKHKNAMQQQKVVTKNAADSMVSDFGRVKKSIEDAISSMQSLNSMWWASYGISGYANGGVVEWGFKAFASWGVVNKPTLGLVGEGKDNEAVVPLPDGNRIPVEMKWWGGNVLNINLNGNFYGSDDEFADRIGDTIISKFQQADQGNFARF